MHWGLLHPSHAPPPKPHVDARGKQRWRANKQACNGHCDFGKNTLYVQSSVWFIDGYHSLWALERKVPCNLAGLARHIGKPDLVELTRCFLYDQINPKVPLANEIALEDCPQIYSKISVFGSASATFYAPSDESGIRGMRHECIWSTHCWRNQGLWHDCALVVKDETKPGIKGLTPMRVMLFFSFAYQGKTYPCALVEWFKKYGSHPDKETGIWRVRPHFMGRHWLTTVVHLDSFLQDAHLLPVFSGAMCHRWWGLDTISLSHKVMWPK